MAIQDDYIKTALRLPRHLHADATVAAEAAGRSLNAELIHRIGQSADLSHLHRVIEQAMENMKNERMQHGDYLFFVVTMFEQALRALDETLLLAKLKNATDEDLERLRVELENGRGAIKAFAALAASLREKRNL
jgi:tRNA(Ile2) C34 agmatinyltransferase TiaS